MQFQKDISKTYKTVQIKETSEQAYQLASIENGDDKSLNYTRHVIHWIKFTKMGSLKIM